MKEGTSAVCWNDKREVYLLTTTHILSALGNYVDEEGNAAKRLCIESYNSMGFVGMVSKQLHENGH